MTLPMDRLVPTEIWLGICSYLYPSQLTRLSRVSRTLYEVVTTLKVWNHYYSRIWWKASSVDMPRDPLRLYPGATTKHHMLYVVAASYLVCESCASVSHPWSPQKYAALPLAVPE